MAISRVNRTTKKPIGWWYHKILCEIGYHMSGSSSSMYYNHLRKLCNYGFNLYGDKI